MTPILQAAAQGYTAQQIISYVSQAFPNLSPRIKKAASSGYTTNQILKYLNQLMEEESFSKFTTVNEREGKHRDKLNVLGKQILGSGATALGLQGFQQSLPPLAQTLLGNPVANAAQQQGQTPPITTGLAQTANPSQLGQQQNQTIAAQPLQQSGSPIATPSQQMQLPEIPQLQQPAVQQSVKTPAQQPPSLDSISIIKELGLEEKINNLLKQGVSPENISSQIVPSLNPKQRKLFTDKVRTGQAITMPSIIADYASKVPISPMQTAPNAPQSPEMIGVLPKVQKEEKKPLSKGSFVSTPQGLIGNIESERNGQALVKDESGKLHKTKVEDLIESPLPEKDLADLFDDVVKGIEHETGEEVSRNVNWAGYDPESNSLAYRPHLGGLWVYDDIPSEDVELLTNMLTQRKTSGENFIGAWKEGSKSPIGAAMSALIKKLQAERGGKGKEYANKFLTLYDALGPAAEASKKKKKAKK